MLIYILYLIMVKKVAKGSFREGAGAERLRGCPKAFSQVAEKNKRFIVIIKGI